MFCCRGRARTADRLSPPETSNQAALPTELHDTHLYLLSEVQAHAGAKPCLRYLVIRWWQISEPSLRLFALFIFRIPAAHSASNYLPRFPRSYTTTYHNVRPTRELSDSELTSLHLVVLTGWDTVSFHSFRIDVSFDAVLILVTYRLAPWLLTVLCDLNKCCRLLAGFARCTTLGVRGGCGIRTARTQSGTDLQSAAFDRSAKPPNYLWLSWFFFLVLW